MSTTLGEGAAKLYVGATRAYAAIGDAIAAEVPDAPTVVGEGGDLDPSGGGILLLASFSSDGGAPVTGLAVTVDGVTLPAQGYELFVGYTAAYDRWDVEITEDGASLSGAGVAIAGTNVVGTGADGTVTLDTY